MSHTHIYNIQFFLFLGLYGRRTRQRDIAPVRHSQSARSKTQGLEDHHVAFIIFDVGQPPSQQQQRHIRTYVEHIDIEFPVERQTDGGQSDGHRIRTAEGAEL